MEEPSQKIGDYLLSRSEHETGRVFSSVKDLGSDRGAAVGEEVKDTFHGRGATVPFFGRWEKK